MTVLSELSGFMPGSQDLVAVDVSGGDFEYEGGFHLHAAAGDVNVRTIKGDADIVITLAAAGMVTLGGVMPVLLKAVRKSKTTSASMQAGLIT